MDERGGRLRPPAPHRSFKPATYWQMLCLVLPLMSSSRSQLLLAGHCEELQVRRHTPPVSPSLSDHPMHQASEPQSESLAQLVPQ